MNLFLNGSNLKEILPKVLSNQQVGVYRRFLHSY